MNWTLDDIQKSKVARLNQHLSIKKTVRKKYGNNKKEVDGILFDSEKESKRYVELKLLAKIGEIGILELQVPYELNPGGSYSYKYIADFVYIDARTGDKVVEDVKGFRTREYLRKRRLMLKNFGIKIKET